MDINQKKEQFNKAYICAIAAQAGINHSQPTVDDDSIDLELFGKGFSGQVRNPRIEIQLKCTSRDVIRDSSLKFALSKKNYDDLRATNISSPRYLLVLIVPDDSAEWISHNQDEMLMKHSCYWVSIRDFPESENTSSVTIDIPLSQKVTHDSLRVLLDNASNGINS